MKANNRSDSRITKCSYILDWLWEQTGQYTESVASPLKQTVLHSAHDVKR